MRLLVTAESYLNTTNFVYEVFPVKRSSADVWSESLAKSRAGLLLSSFASKVGSEVPVT